MTRIQDIYSSQVNNEHTLTIIIGTTLMMGIEVFTLMCVYHYCKSLKKFEISNSQDDNESSHDLSDYSSDSLHMSQGFTDLPMVIRQESTASVIPKTAPHIFLNRSSTDWLTYVNKYASYTAENEHDDNNTQSSEFDASIPTTEMELPLVPVHDPIPMTRKQGRLSSIKGRLKNIYKRNVLDTLRCLRIKKSSKVYRKMSNISSEYSYYQLA